MKENKKRNKGKESMTLDNILEEIKKANTIAILTHENPDGDAIGSSLAMNLALKKMGKNPDLIIPEYSRTYKFLPGIEDIKEKGQEEKYNLAIAVDCSDIKRLNGWANYFENAKNTVSIDHHEVNTMFADYNYVDMAAPACCQILVMVLEYFGIEINKEIGTCLLTGIITDTGGFKYEGVTAETFEFAASLLGKGINVSSIYQKVLQVRSRAHYELSKMVMDRMEFLQNDKITFTYITEADEEKVHSEVGDHEGLVEIGRDIEGVEVSIFLRQKENGFKVSLRSNGKVNVSDVCLMFGGGGHARAAGAYVQGDLEQAKAKVLAEVEKAIK